MGLVACCNYLQKKNSYDESSHHDEVNEDRLDVKNLALMDIGTIALVELLLAISSINSR